MFGQCAAVGRDDLAPRALARRTLLAEIGVDERGVVAVGHEANLLAVALSRHREAHLAGHLAHPRLPVLAQREQRPRQLLLRQTPQKIGLIARFVHRAIEQMPAGTLVEPQARVMARRDPHRAERGGHLQELIELDEVVAQRARNRRAPRQILVNEGPHHLALEPLFEIHHVIRNAELLRHPPRVVDVVERAAAARGAIGSQLRQPPLVPELHGQPNDRHSLPVQDSRNRGAVHAAAHRDRDQALRHAPAPPARRAAVAPPLRRRLPPTPPPAPRY